MLLKRLFWGSLVALAWTHAGYPIAAAALARLRPREVHEDDIAPSVSVVVAAHDEEAVIGRRLENLLNLHYPPDRLEFIVASDGSGDRTDAIVAEIAGADARVRLLRLPRGGKYAALDAAAREAVGEILAFTDANTLWEANALAKLVRGFADPEVGYVCGQLRLAPCEGTNRESAYWRYELWLRKKESSLGSITGGNGAIWAVRRSDYPEHLLDHDIALPPLMVQRGRRAVYSPEALAFEQPARDLEDEYRRKVRMFALDWGRLVEGTMLRDVGPLYLVELISHRVLRYSSGLLHLVLLVTSAALARRGCRFTLAFAGQLGWLALAGAGRCRPRVRVAGLAYYYFLVTWATVAGLARYLRVGAPTVWERAPGSR